MSDMVERLTHAGNSSKSLASNAHTLMLKILTLFFLNLPTHYSLPLCFVFGFILTWFVNF